MGCHRGKAVNWGQLQRIKLRARDKCDAGPVLTRLIDIGLMDRAISSPYRAAAVP